METSPHDSPRQLDRLLNLADRVGALAQVTGRVAASRDAALATELLATDGECDRCDSAVRDAWSDFLATMDGSTVDQSSALELLVSLEKIADLAANICERVIRVSASESVGDLPSIRRLAELVPELLVDALRAVRANDRPSAQKVLDRTIAMDACFAQVHLDLLQVARQGGKQLDAAQQFHALGRALERIGDGAGEIAASVRHPAAAALES
jgi:phosphate transport system protein